MVGCVKSAVLDVTEGRIPDFILKDKILIGVAILVRLFCILVHSVQIDHRVVKSTFTGMERTMQS